MATHVLTLGIDGSGIKRSQDISSTDGGVILLDAEPVWIGVDVNYNFTLDVSHCASFYIESSLDIQIETNAIDAAGGNTLVLRANEPYVWHTTSYDSFLFTEDIATMYITNSTGATATLHCVALFDPALDTPP